MMTKQQTKALEIAAGHLNVGNTESEVPQDLNSYDQMRFQPQI